MGIFKGASPDIKNKFFYKFLTFIEKYICPLGLNPLWGILKKCFIKFKMNSLVFAMKRRFRRSALYLPCCYRRYKSAGSSCTFSPAPLGQGGRQSVANKRRCSH